jgi:hypothetical protein
MNPAQKTDFDSRLLSPEQAAPIVGLRYSPKAKDRVSFYRAVHAWNVPFFRLGPKTIRFSRDDLQVWLRSRRVGGTSP